MGNVKKFRQASTYQLKELEKSDDLLITGKMVRNFRKPTERIVYACRYVKPFLQTPMALIESLQRLQADIAS